MAKIAKNLNELIGNTPLLQLSNFASNKNFEANVIVKLESFNPAGCVKERIALAMVEAAEAAGILKPGVEIIEPTSGNTGIGLAMVSAVKGYKLTLTMPETMSIERRNLLKALGANLVLTPGANGMKGAIARAIELHEENPASFIPQQFENAANPEVHYRTTGAEIWNDTDGKIDIFVEVKEENIKLKKLLADYDETFVRWFANATSHGMSIEELEAPLPHSMKTKARLKDLKK